VGGVLGFVSVVVGVGEVAPGLAENSILYTCRRCCGRSRPPVLRRGIAGAAILEDWRRAAEEAWTKAHSSELKLGAASTAPSTRRCV
jgi:hypothetical protein